MLFEGLPKGNQNFAMLFYLLFFQAYTYITFSIWVSIWISAPVQTRFPLLVGARKLLQYDAFLGLCREMFRLFDICSFYNASFRH